MKFQNLAISSLWAGCALAAPLEKKQSTNIDVTVLQFALTLEHLENVFYHGALEKFTEQDFINAGYSATYYNNLKYISADEESHVQTLTSAIAAAGAKPVAACKYNFGYTDVRSFITLSSVLEGVGTSAYLAGAGLITSKAYLTVAGSILVTEALHTSMQRGAIGEVPMANPYGTPLDPTAVFTLAASFITSCPADNAPLPFTAFPGLTYNSSSCVCEEPNCSPSQAVKRDGWGNWNGQPAPSASSASAAPKASSSPAAASPAAPAACAPPSAGATIELTASKAIPAGSWVTFISGLSVVSVQGTISGNSVKVAIPSVAAGQTYVLITKSDVEGALVDSAVLYGPAIVEVNPAPPAINYSIY